MIVEYSIIDFKPIIHVWTRNAARQKVYKQVAYKPYFYVDESVIIRADKRIDSVQSGFRNLFGGSVKRIYTKFPKNVAELKDEIILHKAIGMNFDTVDIPHATYEADIPFTTRFRLDHGAEYQTEDTNPKVFYVDIEVLSDHFKFSEVYKAESPIPCISIVDGDTGKYYSFAFKSGSACSVAPELKNRVNGQLVEWKVFVFETEKEMLEKFIEFVRKEDPDIITGWNVIKFDMLYLLRRIQVLGININLLSPLGFATCPSSKEEDASIQQEHNKNESQIRTKRIAVKGYVLFDLLRAFRKAKMRGLQSNALETVANDLLGVGKYSDAKKVVDFYNNDFFELLRYNMYDSELCYEIDKKAGTINFYHGLATFMGCKMEDTIYNSQMADFWFLKGNGDVVLPTKKKNTPLPFKGATVMTPEKGLYENISVLDYARLYPSIIISVGMSPETLTTNVGNVVTLSNGISFRKDIEGFVPRKIKSAFAVRDQKDAELAEAAIKYGMASGEYQRAKQMRDCVKGLINSFYGYFGYINSRLFSLEIASSVTAFGRDSLEWSKHVIEDNQFKVIYGDTDSMMFSVGNADINVVVDRSKDIAVAVNSSFDNFVQRFNIDRHTLSIKFETGFSTILFGKAKKRYAGYITYRDGVFLDKPLFVSKGFENRRSDSSRFTQNLQTEVLKLVCSKKSFEEVDAFVHSKVNEMLSGKVSFDDSGIPRNINRKIPLGKISKKTAKTGEYKVTSPHIKGIQYANKYLSADFGTGDKPMLLYISKSAPGYPKTKELCFEHGSDVPNGFIVNNRKMAEVLIHKKMERIYAARGWKYSLRTMSQNTLEKFFLMPTKNNYRNGAAKERRILAKYKERYEDALVLRSAGSHSKIDCVIVVPSTGRIFFVQSKPRKMSNNAKRKLELELVHLIFPKNISGNVGNFIVEVSVQ